MDFSQDVMCGLKSPLIKYKGDNMGYVEKIEKVMSEYKGDAEAIGIEVAGIMNDENYSYGELAAIEEELGKLGTSMNEDIYLDLQRKFAFVIDSEAYGVELFILKHYEIINNYGYLTPLSYVATAEENLKLLGKLEETGEEGVHYITWEEIV